MIALALILVVLLLIYYKESFVNQFDMLIRHSRNPISVNYMGRLKDPRGYDYFDHRLTEELYYNNFLPK